MRLMILQIIQEAKPICLHTDISIRISITHKSSTPSLNLHSRLEVKILLIKTCRGAYGTRSEYIKCNLEV